MKNIARRSLMLLGFIASCSTVLASCKINNGSKIEDIKNLDTSITWWNNYKEPENKEDFNKTCLLYTSPGPRDETISRMPSCA